MNVVAFEKLADNCILYLEKGSKVLVVGRLSVSEYEKNGEKKEKYEVVANKVEFLSPKIEHKSVEGESDMPFPEVEKKVDKPVAKDDDLPF